MAHVLIVEDAPDALELATATLRSAGHTTSAATTAAEALRGVRARPPEVILLDLGLPDADGTDLCREMRTLSDAYILMLTARDDEVDKVLGLKMGADDYVTKPYSPRELTARIEALLRRPRAAMEEPVAERRIGDLVVRPLSHDVLLDGAPLQLTRIEFAILDALSESPERVLSREQLRSRVWGEDWFAGEHSLDVHMTNLRRKIDRNGVAHIRTVRGVGYRMAEQVSETAASGGMLGA
jgi:DNA-binding response OmpR family regulator